MNFFDNNEDDILNEMDTLLSSDIAVEAKINTPKVELIEDDAILVPLDYQIFAVSNGDVNTGKRELIDTYKCDRVRGITPSGKARIKADLMKKAFSAKKFFVVENSSKILPNGKTVVVEKIIYQTK